MTKPTPAFHWPSAKLMGATFLSADEESGVIEMSFTPPASFANMNNQVQGGLVAGFVDEAFGAALYLGTGGKLQLSLDLAISFLRPVPMEPFTVKARCVKAGRRIVFLEAELFSQTGDICARATATSMATEWQGASRSEIDE